MRNLKKSSATQLATALSASPGQTRRQRTVQRSEDRPTIDVNRLEACVCEPSRTPTYHPSQYRKLTTLCAVVNVHWFTSAPGECGYRYCDRSEFGMAHTIDGVWSVITVIIGLLLTTRSFVTLQTPISHHNVTSTRSTGAWSISHLQCEPHRSPTLK